MFKEYFKKYIIMIIENNALLFFIASIMKNIFTLMMIVATKEVDPKNL